MPQSEPKTLSLATDTPSRKIRFIGLSPTSPVSPPNAVTKFKESPLKECPPLHLSYEDDKPSPIKESDEQLLTDVDIGKFYFIHDICRKFDSSN